MRLPQRRGFTARNPKLENKCTSQGRWLYSLNWLVYSNALKCVSLSLSVSLPLSFSCVCVCVDVNVYLLVKYATSSWFRTISPSQRTKYRCYFFLKKAISHRT